NTRLNDGRVDRFGDFVVGGVVERFFDGSTPNIKTSVYRLFKNLTYQKIIQNVGCSNSICWNKNGDIMYFTDSRIRNPNRIIYKYQYCNKINNKNNLLSIPKFLNN